MIREDTGGHCTEAQKQIVRGFVSLQAHIEKEGDNEYEMINVIERVRH
jgi:hypothetical protein